MVSHLSGMMAEYLLANEFRSKKRFSLSRYFTNVADDTELNITDARMRVKFQRADGKEMEIDVVAESDCGRTVVVESKNSKEPAGPATVTDFLEKAGAYAALRPEKQVLPAFFSYGGFTKEAQQYCEENGVAIASRLELFT